MKILIDNTSFLPVTGGTETYSYQLMTSFSPKEIDLQMICQVPKEGLSELNTFPIIRVGYLGVKNGYHYESQEADLALGMNRIFKDKEDAAHSFKNVREAGLEPYYAAVDQFNPDIVLVNDLMRVIGAPFIQHVLFAYDAKIVVNLHGILTSFGAFWDFRPDRKKLAQDLIARDDLPVYFIAPSKYVYDTALEWGVKEEHLELIYLGVDTDFFTPPMPQEKTEARERILKELDEESALSEETILISFPSRAVSHKGFDTALKALKLVLKNKPGLKWKFLIAGGASDNPESIQDTQGLIEQISIQERILVGTDSFGNFPVDMRIFHQACDLCLFPSRREALGYGALESMSCGVPVVGTSIPGLSEALGVKPYDSGECPAGWAVVPDDLKALVSQLEAVLENPTVLKAKGQEARKWIEENFKLERMIAEHLEYFKKILT